MNLRQLWDRPAGAAERCRSGGRPAGEERAALELARHRQLARSGEIVRLVQALEQAQQHRDAVLLAACEAVRAELAHVRQATQDARQTSQELLAALHAIRQALEPAGSSPPAPPGSGIPTSSPPAPAAGPVGSSRAPPGSSPPSSSPSASAARKHAPMDVLASTALVLGLLSLFTWLLGPYGIGLALAGIIVALLGWHAQPGGAARLGCALSYASLLAALFVTLVLMRYHLPPFAPPGP